MGAPDACVAVGVIIGVEVAIPGVGVFVLGAFNGLACAEPPTILKANMSTSVAVKMMNRRFGFPMGIPFRHLGFMTDDDKTRKRIIHFIGQAIRIKRFVRGYLLSFWNDKQSIFIARG